MDAAAGPVRSCGRRGLSGLALVVAVAAALTVAAPSQAAPAVDLSFTPVVPLVGQTVTFTATGTPETDATVASYGWDLDGDGSLELNTALSPVATATYAAEGTITVTVRMRDSFGNRVNRSRVLTVGGRPPLAAFTVTPARPVAGRPVTFRSSASDPDGTVAEQAWDLDGDGVFDNGGGATAMRVFAMPGSYVIGLRVTDNEAHASFHSQTVTVGLGTSGLWLLNPFPVVRISGTLTSTGVRLRLVSITAPAGTTVRVRCGGRGCPFGRKVRTTAKRGQRIRVRDLETSLRAGVRIRIYMTSPGTVGKYMVFTIRRGKQPLRDDSCVLHGSSRPLPCSSR